MAQEYRYAPHPSSFNLYLSTSPRTTENLSHNTDIGTFKEHVTLSPTCSSATTRMGDDPIATASLEEKRGVVLCAKGQRIKTNPEHIPHDCNRQKTNTPHS